MKRDFPIVVAGKTYLLRYNYDALIFVEDMTGKSFFEALAELQKGSLTTLKVLLTAGLRKHHQDVENVSALIDDADDLTALMKSVIEAVNNYFAKSKPEPATKKKSQAASNSKTDA